jgi:hypothetical protein
MSGQMMKDLGLLHPNFPHHLKLPQATHQYQQTGVFQILRVIAPPLSTTPKRVQFGSPQGPTDTKMSRVVMGTE